MKFRTLSACALVCAFLLTVGAGASGASAQDNKSTQASDAKVSSGERDAAEKINKAKGGEAKLQAAAEFIKKYPKSSMRPRIAEAIANEISATPEAELKISLSRTYLDFFNQPAEADYINGTLLRALLDTDKSASNAAEIFKLAPAWLDKHPEDVDTLRRLAVTGSNAAIAGNNAYVAQAQQYGAKAIELIEADKKPEAVDAAQWAEYKSKQLPGLYREAGILALRSGDKAAGRARLEKAITLNTPDPSVYAIVGQMADEDYTTYVNEYKAAPAGAARDAALKKAQAQLDKVIDLYAQSVALTEGHAEYDQLRGQVMPALEEYYKFRHNNSSDGLQQLIDKFKKPATQ
jgi:hypothetical protein